MKYTKTIIPCLTLAMIFLVLNPLCVYGCTEFSLSKTINEKSLLVGRTLDYHLTLETAIRLIPEDTHFQSIIKADSSKEKWISKYGFLEICVRPCGKKKWYAMDGINEEGLSASLLGLKGTKYPNIAKNKKNICIDEFISWCLSNFSNVLEVKNALKIFSITGIYNKDIASIPEYHISVYDQKGNNLIIEFKNKRNFYYQNKYGVLTNSPFYNHQCQIYDLYTKIPYCLHTAFFSLLNFIGFNPSEISSINRFIFANELKISSKPVENLTNAVILAFRLLNKLSLLKKNQKTTNIYTQWSVVKDLKNRTLYCSPNNMSVYKFELKRINFSQGTIKTILFPNKTILIDNTNEL